MLASPSPDSETAHAHWFSECPGVSNRPGVSSCLYLSLHHTGTFIIVRLSPTHAQFIASPYPTGGFSGLSRETEPELGAHTYTTKEEYRSKFFKYLKNILNIFRGLNQKSLIVLVCRGPWRVPNFYLGFFLLTISS